jgi:radical SAM superfamily enzyme YgiQ (UPF0313 family)
MKILLISANRHTSPYPVYPLGLDYVSNSISNRHEQLIVDMNVVKNNRNLAKIITDFLPDIIGLSIRNIDNTDAVDAKSFVAEYEEILRTIRANSPAKVVLGGSGYTLFPRELLNELAADYGVIGEGERFGRLIEVLENGGDPLTIPGVVTPQSQPVIPKPWDGSLERKLNPSDGSIEFYLKNGGMLNMQSKRGCSFNCIYCTYPYIEGHTLRLIPPGDAGKTARKLQDAGARYIFITDSAFNCSISHSIEVARAFMRAGVSIPWGAFFAPIAVPDDYFKILSDAGLSHVEFGTESLSDEILKNYSKPFALADVFATHRAALDSGVHVAHYFLLGGPGENRETLKNTLENALGLDKTVLFFFCGIRIFPNTKLFGMALNEGQINRGDNLVSPVFYFSPGISRDEIINTVNEYAAKRNNWIVGSVNSKTLNIIYRMYALGRSGPLWENLIR